MGGREDEEGKQHTGRGLREGDDRDALLDISIVCPFVNLITVFASLLNYMRVFN